MTSHLPAVLPSGAIAPTNSGDTLYMVPALIADLGDPAAWRYVEFFAANIRNPNTRRAYARACSRFFVWCENRGLTLTAIRPFDVGEWVEQLQENHGPAGVKQQLAAVRMMFNWLVTGQVAPVNPAAAVRGWRSIHRADRMDCYVRSRALIGAGYAFLRRSAGVPPRGAEDDGGLRLPEGGRRSRRFTARIRCCTS